jgi:hypothetical protein
MVREIQSTGIEAFAAAQRALAAVATTLLTITRLDDSHV